MSAQSNLVYSLIINYDNGNLTLGSLNFIEGGQTPNVFISDVKYKAKIISFTEEILYQTNFSFEIAPIFAALPEWFDEEGNQIIIPNETGIITLNETSFDLVLPYFPNAEKIEVYSPENELALTIDVSEYALCETEEECEDKSFSTCTSQEECIEFLETLEEEALIFSEPDEMASKSSNSKLLFGFLIALILVLVALTIFFIVKKIKPKKFEREIGQEVRHVEQEVEHVFHLMLL